MLVKSWFFRATLCLALFLRIEADLTVENNAYQNVVVSFSSRLSSESSNHLVDSMQKILNDATLVLHTAVGLKIGSVTFNLPRAWNSSAWPNVVPISSYNAVAEPDIRVTLLTDSAFGRQPVALQYGGCGVPALDISIPNEYLMNEEESYPKGKILAREWLKYRYGVFDENGFLDDPLYPTHYTISGSDEIHITDCTSPKLGYSFRDSENNSCVLTAETAANCSIRPNEEEVEDVKSSLMFYHEELQQLNHVCGKEEGNHHNVQSLNKQNLLCSYKSIWEVMQSSEDIKSMDSTDSSQTEGIKYTFVQESELRLVVAWEDTTNLRKQGNTILKVVRKLMYDIPDDSKVALYSFKGGVVNEPVPFGIISQETRKSWTPSSRFVNSEEGKPLIAVDKAVNVLQAENEEDKPGIIVLFTATGPDENPDLVEKLKKSKLCLTVIGFSGTTKEAWSKFLEVSTCSSFLEMPDSDNQVDIYKTLYNAVEPILPLPTEDYKTHTVSIKMLSPPPDHNLEISANSRAKTFTVWIFDDIELACLVNETTVYITKTIVSQPLVSYTFEAQNDTVKCHLKDGGTDTFLVHVQMTTIEGGYFNNKVWFRDTTPSNSTEQMPLIIYAKIFYGEYPVRDAHVQAEVITPNKQKVVLTLVDDGRGDPDVTRNDGIYSKYFTKFDSTGTYQVIITATDKGKAEAGRNGQDPCCGSVVVSDSSRLSEFSWTHEISFDTDLPKPEKGYNPSRVTDLKVSSLNLPASLTLKWTAPGEEMDEGKASDYEFIMFCQHPDCHADGVLPNWIGFPNKMKPKVSGTNEAVTVQFYGNKPENITVYIAIKAINTNQQISEVSNRVHLKLPPSSPQETTTPEITKDGRKPSNSAEAGSIVAYVIISIAILMLIIGIIYFLLDRTKRRKAMEEQNTPAAFTSTDGGEVFSFKSVAPPVDNPIRRAESIPVVLYTHNQIKDFKDKTKQPPLYRLDAPPKPWSSLNALIDGNRSSSSNSTMIVGDSKTQSSEIIQLDDVSLRAVPLHEKNSKF